MRFTILILSSLFLFSCSHSIHLVHVSDFSPYQSKKADRPITAESEQFSIMGFNSDTKYVDDAYAQLMSKCKDGIIEGITTQYSTSHGFFSWTNKILMQGSCIRKN